MAREVDDVAASLARLGSAAPVAMLEQLARLGDALAKAGRSRPEVVIGLAGGQPLRGQLVTASRDGVAIATPPTVVLVNPADIAAVTIDASDLARLARPELTAGEPPSRLALVRQVASAASGLAVKLAVANALEDDGRRAVASGLAALCDAVGAIYRDELGRQALATIEMIELAAATQLAVDRAATTITVRLPTLVGETVTSDAIRRALERVL